jgi:hypothetical protein
MYSGECRLLSVVVGFLLFYAKGNLSALNLYSHVAFSSGQLTCTNVPGTDLSISLNETK